MSAILVVDDDDIIRATLVALLEAYQTKNNLNFEVLEASRGEEAITICSQKNINLLFLDILMPGMTGIEAAVKIKKTSPKTMIVAISSLSDESKQNEMLQSGAEDYITKPIVASLFTNRLHNYLRIIQSRDTIGFKHNAINTFTATIYNYKMDFSIATEDELTQFWETALIRFEMQRMIPDIHEVTRFLHRLGTVFLHYKYSFHIFLEEDKEHFYISINHIKLLGASKVEKLILDHYNDAVFNIKEDTLTFLLDKENYETVPEPEPDISIPKPKVPEAVTSQPVQTKPKPKVVKELTVFHFLDHEELDDLDDNLDKLHHIIIRMSSHELNADDCESIAQFFQIIAQTISLSSETYLLSSSLQNLARILTSNQELFIQQSKNLSEFVLAFVNDLIQWKDMVFYSGAPSIDFMDASIVANIQMITVLLSPQDKKEEENLDDIFDF
ncbi:MAG: response regulator [Thiovulaceae bacterium]|nr:response regulator [Sulfurimonadaceae bacterium]